MGQKWPVRKADNLAPSCAIFTKSGKLKFLEHSGPLGAYNGTALPFYIIVKVTAVAQWLRCCATNRKVAGSIPGGVTGIFH